MKELPEIGDLVRRKYTEDYYLVLRQEYSERSGQLSTFTTQEIKTGRYIKIVYHEMYDDFVKSE
jgi:hypothetical protein